MKILILLTIILGLSLVGIAQTKNKSYYFLIGYAATDSNSRNNPIGGITFESNRSILSRSKLIEIINEVLLKESENAKFHIAIISIYRFKSKKEFEEYDK